MCDASDYAVGAVLGKRIKKHFWPINYASKTMNQAETNYTTTEKEMLAVVYAFEKFRSYLIMNKSIVYTDHSALKYLFAKKVAKARLLRDCERDVNVNETFHEQTDDELFERELKQIKADDQAIQTILFGLPEDIYVAVDSCKTAQEIWLRVQQMMKGSDIGIQ
nr:reverse transcriptase domain-containing protein [Tanacetum cinerariifolium]